MSETQPDPWRDDLTEGAEMQACILCSTKEHGYTHEQIGDVLGISKSTVDEYSCRINERVKRAERTVEELAARRGR